MFLDIELEFILLEEEERDYMIMEIDLSKEVVFLFGLEDIEFFSDKDDSFLVFLKNFCNVKEQVNFLLEILDLVIREVVEEVQKKLDLKRVFFEVRFNLFDRDLYMEEEYYIDDGIFIFSSEQEYKFSMFFLCLFILKMVNGILLVIIFCQWIVILFY